jgi:CubicO group peptidase (beta-lactamase class C family)
MTINRIKTVLGLILLTLTLSACSDNSGMALPLEKTPYQYQMPPLKNDGWPVGHLLDAGIDEGQITQLVKDLHEGVQPGIDSLTIVRDGKLLLHENLRTELSAFDHRVGNQDLERHVMHSTSKSFVSALVGIAIDRGYIAGTDNRFYPYFNYSNIANWDYRKESITLENVLTMQLGFAWDEWNIPFGEKNNSLTELTNNNDDFVKALLDLPLNSDPGTEFAYNSVASIALGAVVELSTAQPLAEFALQNLFQPLQIADADWLMTPTGLADTGTGLFLPTRDMAKFGQLYLNRGNWNGLQVISEDWINRSLAQSVKLSGNYTTGYGYQWWLGNFKRQDETITFYSSRGFGGQFIVIVPDYNLVVAFTAHNYHNDLYELPFKLIEQYILPAINP